MFHGLAKKAQYFYYTKLRLATCMPSKCTPADMDLIGEQSKYCVCVFVQKLYREKVWLSFWSSFLCQESNTRARALIDRANFREKLTRAGAFISHYCWFSHTQHCHRFLYADSQHTLESLQHTRELDWPLVGQFLATCNLVVQVLCACGAITPNCKQASAQLDRHAIELVFWLALRVLCVFFSHLFLFSLISNLIPLSVFS